MNRIDNGEDFQNNELQDFPYFLLGYKEHGIFKEILRRIKLNNQSKLTAYYAKFLVIFSYGFTNIFSRNRQKKVYNLLLELLMSKRIHLKTVYPFFRMHIDKIPFDSLWDIFILTNPKKLLNIGDALKLINYSMYLKKYEPKIESRYIELLNNPGFGDLLAPIIAEGLKLSKNSEIIDLLKNTTINNLSGLNNNPINNKKQAQSDIRNYKLEFARSIQNLYNDHSK